MEGACSSAAAPRLAGVLCALLVAIGSAGEAPAQPSGAAETAAEAEAEAGAETETAAEAEAGAEAGAETEAEAGAGAETEAGAEAEPAAAADTPADTAADTDTAQAEDAHPWAQGVSQEQREKAQALYDAGNALLRDFLLAEAVDRYREALRHWNHPGIHYNMARALYYLGRPLEAYHSIREALRYGPVALQQHEHTQALDFQARIEQRLTWLEVACDQPGLDIALDGQPLLTGAGRARKPLLPGEHLLVANQAGALPASRRLRLLAGRHTRIALSSRQRWRPWKPWAVLGAGAAVGLTGAILQWRATADIDRYRRDFGLQCPTGCRDSQVPELTALRTRGQWLNRIGVSAMVAGSGVALSGAIMVALNRSRSIRIRLTSPKDRRTGLSIAPALSAESLGAAAILSF